MVNTPLAIKELFYILLDIAKGDLNLIHNIECVFIYDTNDDILIGQYHTNLIVANVDGPSPFSATADQRIQALIKTLEV